jgi:predicted RNA binding protein YcfA (HicA-like mRNA interferase family)
MAGSKLPAARAKEVVRALEKSGFTQWRQKGRHLTMYRAADQRVLTVPMHFAKTVPKGTLRTIIRSTGLGVEEFVGLLKV